MRNKLLLVLLLLLLLPLSSAEREDLYDYEFLLLKTTVKSNIGLKPTAPDYVVDFVSANVSWVPPDDYRQRLTKIETEPDADIFNKSIQFRWNRPTTSRLSFEATYYVTTYSKFQEIKQKSDFPIRYLPREYQKYLGSHEIIDINEDIEELASELSEDEDDLFKVIFNLAEWIKTNIEYDLNTVTINANQKSSWVLNKKQGVCDELTSLFISLCRSLGIPAKFVSGISYTNLPEFTNPWGPHGWAEVYIPDAGWVPVDVTYGQVGYVDATHIKMQESSDAMQSSAHYLSRGRNIEIQTERMETSTTVLQKGEPLESLIYLELDTLYDPVGFGSYNLIELKVKNKKPYYVIETFMLSRTDELEVLDDYKKTVFLEPYEEKTLQWIVVVSDRLKKGYKYTFTIMVESDLGDMKKEYFKSNSYNQVYSYNDVKKHLITEEAETKKSGLSIDCSPDRKKAYIGENLKINCLIENNGIGTEKVEVCFEDSCEEERILGFSSFEISFEKELDQTGIQNLLVKLKSPNIVKKNYILMDVLDDAEIQINDLSYPDKLLFGEKTAITFRLDSDSESVPENIKLKLVHKFFEKDWEIMDLQNPVFVKFEFGGSDLDFDNEFKIIIDYEDELGKKFSAEETFHIKLANPNLWEKMLVYSNRIEAWFEGLVR